MSKKVNLYVSLSAILRNHSITSLLSFHWLILRQSSSWWFIYRWCFYWFDSKNQLQLYRKNIKSIINSYNKKDLPQNRPCQNERKCNCIRKELCPLNGNCQAWKYCVRNQHHMQSTNLRREDLYRYSRNYITIKDRYSNHKISFNLAAHRHDTKFSKEFWKIKCRNSVPKIKSRILRKSSRFNRSSLRCNLCLNEKLEIVLFKGSKILNRRTELISKCRYVNKHTLLRHDTKD